MKAEDVAAKASELVSRWRRELLRAAQLGPVLDVACGDGRNGLYLALAGRRQVPGWFPEALLVDRSEDAWESLRQAGLPRNVAFRLMDLETPEPPSFGAARFGVVLVFRYLHRPLIPALRACLIAGGVLACETFLEGQEVYGRPRNPDHLLRRGELMGWFGDWDVLEHFEGDLDNPPRVMGRIVCRKPRGTVATGPPA